MNEFRHKKSLGQHFLKDKNIIRKIVDISEIKPGEQVWEIGPGMGILTEELLNRKVDLTCFEIDSSLYRILEEKFGTQINLVKQDVLKADWTALFPGKKVKIVANLPYQITSPFLFKVARFTEYFSGIVIMIQKEVAQRITAETGTKDYGILTLKLNYFFKIKYEFTIKSHLFFPPPKVDSAVISLLPRENRPELADLELFWKLIEVSFGNRRKMLRKNLQALITKTKIAANLDSCPIDLKRRGETLTEQEFIRLHNWLRSII
ncbi:MAG: hypothetical protein APR54_06945 [Candidatus Cloacimonas sp. SDB]|nr:MAG: hypothetical protein APR54_06945 [Candidatus Cloacimonas sp. SDB]